MHQAAGMRQPKDLAMAALARVRAPASRRRRRPARPLTSELQWKNLQFRRNLASDQLASRFGAVAGSFCMRRRVFAKALRRAFSSKLSVSSMCSMSVKNAKYCWR